jgi:hypothetical protein
MLVLLPVGQPHGFLADEYVLMSLDESTSTNFSTGFRFPDNNVLIKGNSCH